jgi:hypothetical protein
MQGGSTGYAANAVGAYAGCANSSICQSTALGYKAGIGNTNTCRTVHIGACSQNCTGRPYLLELSLKEANAMKTWLLEYVQEMP